MYLVAVGWLYVALMMALAELVHPGGGVLAAGVTFVMYGALPVGLLVYLMATPLRRRARLKAELAAQSATGLPARDAAATHPPLPPAADATPGSAVQASPARPGSADKPDEGRLATGAAGVAPVREEV